MQEKWKFIPDELIERGEIKKCSVTSLKDLEAIEEFKEISEIDLIHSIEKHLQKYLEKGYTIELLLLAPFAIVKHHEHPDTWELRINLKNEQWDSVEIGKQQHRLKNETNKAQLYICIKGKEGSVPKIEEML
jgi:hypothetical protein